MHITEISAQLSATTSRKITWENLCGWGSSTLSPSTLILTKSHPIGKTRNSTSSFRWAWASHRVRCHVRAKLQLCRASKGISGIPAQLSSDARCILVNYASIFKLLGPLRYSWVRVVEYFFEHLPREYELHSATISGYMQVWSSGDDRGAV